MKKSTTKEQKKVRRVEKLKIEGRRRQQKGWIEQNSIFI